MKKLFIIIVSCFIFTSGVNAASKCSYEKQSELNSKSGNIKVSYEIGTMQYTANEGYTVEDDQFIVSILNVTDEFYVTVKNDYDGGEKTYSFGNSKDGIITFEWPYYDKVTNFTISVYSSEKTECPNEKIRTIYFLTPRYNAFSSSIICDEYPDFDYCQKYIYTTDITQKDFDEGIIKYQNKKEEEKKQEEKANKTDVISNIISFVTEHKWIIAGSIVVIGGIGYSIYRVKTKKQRDLGL